MLFAADFAGAGAEEPDCWARMAEMRSLLRILAVPVIPMLEASCWSWARRMALRAPERRGCSLVAGAALSPVVVSVTKDPSLVGATRDGQA
ncbi:hypothetical protein VN1338_10160 [Helicobacter pylori]